VTPIGPDKWIAIAALLATTGCYRMHASDGGGSIAPVAGRRVDAKDVEVPPGYAVEVVTTGLTYPSAIAFDGEGRPHVIESGYAYGEDFRTPRLLRIEDDGTVEEVASGGNPPWTGIDYANGSFYIAEGGAIDGGAIVRIDAKTGEMHELVGNLPSYGDHHTNGPVIGKDGMIYFSIGTATNAAVVGPDNASFGWLQRHPEFHDIPCRDIVLSGHNFASVDPRDGKRSIETGAFMPIGSPAIANQVVVGHIPCTGAVFKMSPTGGDVQLVAWGLRNPYGLGFGSDGELYVTENSYDDRGSRPVWGTGDVLWRIEQGAWYGWPDYWAGIPLEKGFAPQGEDEPQFVLAQHPGDVPEPVAKLGVHASSNGFEVSTSNAFGHRGELFVAQFGDMAPGVGKVWAPVGFNVVRVDPRTGVTHDFATNEGEGLGPASYLDTQGLERPNDADFDPSGRFLYIVDFGVMTTVNGTHPVPNTGVVWRIHREGE
jgi:glucose/arabinose dehydrogenase